jgi:murein DD-endopeptidase MepM/ murein hydrolase activator NlpD
MGSQTQPDIVPQAEQLQPATPSNGSIPSAEAVRQNATVNGGSARAVDMTKVELQNPTNGGRLSSPYGEMRYYSKRDMLSPHNAIDIATTGDAYAAGNGVVSSVGFDAGYGNYVIVDHGGGLSTLYAHGANNSILVKEGMVVSVKQPLFAIGSTGVARGIHLHFEVIFDNVKQDPSKYGVVYFH